MNAMSAATALCNARVLTPDGRVIANLPTPTASTVNASMTGTAGVNRTAPVGNRRFKNPGDNT